MTTILDVTVGVVLAALIIRFWRVLAFPFAFLLALVTPAAWWGREPRRRVGRL